MTNFVTCTFGIVPHQGLKKKSEHLKMNSKSKLMICNNAIWILITVDAGKQKSTVSHHPHTDVSVNSHCHHCQQLSFVWLNGDLQPHATTVNTWHLHNHVCSSQHFLSFCFPSPHCVTTGQEGAVPGVRHPYNLYRHNKPREAACFSLGLQSPYKPWLMKSWDAVCL